MKKTIYTLEELAQDFDLTERTARYYIENVLPPHHKKGRGKKSEYGQDTWNCFAFLQLARERYGLRPGQVAEVLADIPQSTIDRVASGEEELAVATIPSAPSYSGPTKRASERARRYLPMNPIKQARHSLYSFDPISAHKDMLQSDLSALSPEYETNETRYAPEWQQVFRDDLVRIQCRLEEPLDDHQLEQIEMAAKLIRLALKM